MEKNNNTWADVKRELYAAAKSEAARFDEPARVFTKNKKVY